MKGDEGITRSEEINGKDSSCQVSNLSTRFGGGLSWHLLPSFQAYFQCNSQPQRTDLTSSGQASAVYTRPSLGPCRYKHEQARVPQLFFIIIMHFIISYYILSFYTCSSVFSTKEKSFLSFKSWPKCHLLKKTFYFHTWSSFPYMIIVSCSYFTAFVTHCSKSFV